MEKLYILPSLWNTFETSIMFTTTKLVHGEELDDFGDREVIDVLSDINYSIDVPKISFLKWIETLCLLNEHGVSSTHLYTRELIPDVTRNNYVWDNVDYVVGNRLTNRYCSISDYLVACKVCIYVYYIEEFNYFAVLRLLSHHEHVTCFRSNET